MSRSLHFHVSGRVQGVFFRRYAKQQADRHGLAGWIRNLPDGRVEGVASGEQDGLESFRKWLQQGPELARVTAVEIEELEFAEFDGFTIK